MIIIQFDLNSLTTNARTQPTSFPWFSRLSKWRRGERDLAKTQVCTKKLGILVVLKMAAGL